MRLGAAAGANSAFVAESFAKACPPVALAAVVDGDVKVADIGAIPQR